MYIKKIEIKNLWGKDFNWTLNEDVNVLVGENGFGKSTIIKIIREAILPVDDVKLNYRIFDPIDEIIIELSNNIVIRANSEERQITGIIDNPIFNLNLSYINTFDVVEKSKDINTTFLDILIENLKNDFVRYQRDLSNQVEEAFNNKTATTQIDKIQSLYNTKNLFIEKLNFLFKLTEKVFDEKNFNFKKNKVENPIEVTKLSSGEKQILIILLTTLLQDNKKFVFLLDEPEISLHVEWQRELINHLRELNPNSQLVLATHSPTLYYKGWIDKTVRIEDLLSETDFTNQSTIILESDNQENQIELIKKEFNNISGNKSTILYKINELINKVIFLTKQQCIEILDYIKILNFTPNTFTFTILISKLNNYKDSKDIFDLLLTESYNQILKISPDLNSLNTLLKKVDSVETGIKLIKEINDIEIFQLRPDVLSFSTLLGKAKTNEEINLIEETRKYFGIKHNETYLNKLNFKR